MTRDIELLLGFMQVHQSLHVTGPMWEVLLGEGLQRLSRDEARKRAGKGNE